MAPATDSPTRGDVLELPAELIDRLADMPPNSAVEFLVEHAVRFSASDLYFGPQEHDVQVCVRRLGIQRRIATLPVGSGQRCIAYVEAEAGMQRTDRRHPRDGHLRLPRPGGQTVNLRLHAMPTLHGDSLAIRLLGTNSDLKQLESLGFVGQQLGELIAMLQRPGGLILVTGPTACGKTTTLYACLHELNDGRRSIHTIESPAEYSVPGLRQTSYDETGAADMSKLLRGLLRHGPDVLAIGEIRDAETADTVVSAASSGRLVLATLNAPFAGTAIQRLLKMGVPPYFLSAGLLGIVGQRLVRTLHPTRRLPMDIGAAPRTFEEVSDYLPSRTVATIFAARDDDSYDGLTAVFEVLKVSPAVRRLIANGESAQTISAQAVSEGMLDLRRSALLKVAQGITSFDEMRRIVPADEVDLEES